jgi:hypothetical protein
MDANTAPCRASDLGAPTATRTRDLPLRRRSLYPLSYRGLPGPLAYLGWRPTAVEWPAEEAVSVLVLGG